MSRKAAEKIILTWIDKLAPGGENKGLYSTMFSKMNDEEFDAFINDLEKGRKRLAVISPNFSKNELSVERNFEIAKELGHSFFKRIWIPAKGDSPSYLTPNSYLVITLPLRRQAQLLDKKISVPEDNNSVDNMTGQPTGKSKGAKISFPEVQVLAALNQKKALTELLKIRGGDNKGFIAMNTMIGRNGNVSLKAIEPFTGQVKSTESLQAMLTGMHLRNNLVE